ncbi:hypothetical protein [Chitinophaga sp. CF418]|uniref:hypothetical protein n=1 Tax=Chitinophaga sp. CF418 TaxID=1855287 RepID=UPI000915356B|nr:hypothetical protein [Chitinophaga sp. CF418]SHN22616.1 hypothetical protein SAMN05216311_10771 [Chitinophaga sp. CF418]
MKAVKSALLLAVVASSLVACSNDDDVNNEVKNGLEGTYSFIAMKADTYAEVRNVYGDTDSDIKEVSSIATCTYQTNNNKGTVTIDANKFNSSKFAYSINATVYGKTYMNGEQSGYSNMPWVIDMPESSGTSSYKLIGTDSIYFSGGFVNSPALGDSVASLPSGAKYKWEGDTLVIASAFILRDTVVEDGATVYSDKRSTQIMRFKKQ